jgi:PAS domain S-box-containing protein
MILFQLSIFFALVVDIVLGLLVFGTNTRRASNRGFLILSGIIGIWLVCLGFGSMSGNAGHAETWIRLSSITAALIPTGLNILRWSIIRQKATWSEIFGGSRYWLLSYLPLAVICLTKFFLNYVVIPGPDSVPKPIYGPGFLVYCGYLVASTLILIITYFRNLQKTSGVQRIELQFVLLGCAAGWATGITFVLMPVFTDNANMLQFLPLSATVLDGIMAYGIATHRIMEVPDVLRRIAAYALLTAYLLTLYAGVWYAAALLIGRVTPSFLPATHLLAALVVAFSLAPAHGHLQRFANRLFINVQPLDVGSTMQNANRILHSISTLDELLKRFAESIAEAVGADRVTILLSERDSFVQHFPAALESKPLDLAGNDPLITTLEKHHEPLGAENIQRLHFSSTLKDAGHRLAELQSAIAVGIYSKAKVEGVMLLGPRLSGRIYGATEQDTLQILCNQLAVALENARLYTQVQDGKIYNDILLDNLVSGIIAANSEGVITVFNREAQRIARLSVADVLNQPMNVLPAPLARAIELTFEREFGLRDQEMTIHHGPGDETPVRLGSSIFRGHAGKVIGALLVFNDLTTLKKLELQVRRTDRLASLGTLAAGMAHEIKNPLVTIKTFTQLLPERYEDTDFRETFSSLIGQEVKRIDSIVNQLLRFSRPAKPNLAPTHLHEVLENSLNLVSEQARQKGITLVRSFTASQDFVHADADQLNQAFINFFLNAIESMSGGGHLSVATEIVRTDYFSPNLWRERSAEGRIRVSIRDTGEGIQPEHVARIFDPFFTTKSHGTGLGLSVAHGIIQEHGGVIDVESEMAKGTTFTIVFPLLNKGATV